MAQICLIFWRVDLFFQNVGCAAAQTSHPLRPPNAYRVDGLGFNGNFRSSRQQIMEISNGFARCGDIYATPLCVRVGDKRSGSYRRHFYENGIPSGTAYNYASSSSSNSSSMDPYGISDDGLQTTKIYYITAYGTTDLEVVYTNEARTVEHTLEKYEQWLEEHKYRFVGLDLEFTRERKSEDPPQRMAVIQIALRHHVLVFHYCRYGYFRDCCYNLVHHARHRSVGPPCTTASSRHLTAFGTNVHITAANHTPGLLRANTPHASARLIDTMTVATPAYV